MPLGRLFDVHEKSILVQEAMLAHAAPVLVRIAEPHTVAILCGPGRIARLLLRSNGRWLGFDAAYNESPRWGLVRLTTALDLLPWCVAISDLVGKWIESGS